MSKLEQYIQERIEALDREQKSDYPPSHPFNEGGIAELQAVLSKIEEGK